MSKRSHPDQLAMPIRKFVVRVDGYSADIQAKSRSAAKWAFYKQMRDAGYFQGGFRHFVHRCPTVQEVFR